MKIKPLNNFVVIKQHDEVETMYGNIIVPDAGKEKPLMGEVIAVGPGAINMFNGALIPMTIKVGQKVTFPSFGGQKLVLGGDEFLLYKESDIFAVLEDEPVELPSKLPSDLVKELIDFEK